MQGFFFLFSSPSSYGLILECLLSLRRDAGVSYAELLHPSEYQRLRQGKPRRGLEKRRLRNEGVQKEGGGERMRRGGVTLWGGGPGWSRRPNKSGLSS